MLWPSLCLSLLCSSFHPIFFPLPLGKLPIPSPSHDHVGITRVSLVHSRISMFCQSRALIIPCFAMESRALTHLHLLRSHVHFARISRVRQVDDVDLPTGGVDLADAAALAAERKADHMDEMVSAHCLTLPYLQSPPSVNLCTASPRLISKRISPILSQTLPQRPLPFSLSLSLSHYCPIQGACLRELPPMSPPTPPHMSPPTPRPTRRIHRHSTYTRGRLRCVPSCPSRLTPRYHPLHAP